MAVIVYGPQGCGKTRNAEMLRKAYGLSSVVDNWDPKTGRSFEPDSLVLTCFPVGEVMGVPTYAKVVNYEDAMLHAWSFDEDTGRAAFLDQATALLRNRSQNELRTVKAVFDLLDVNRAAELNPEHWGRFLAFLRVL